jgi:alcohol dehydrogenase class IV
MKILPIPEIHIGENALAVLPSFLQRVDSQKVMVVTDAGIVNAGIYEQLNNVLKQSSRQVILFDKVEPDPSIELVSRVVEIARKENIDTVIGIGGGSSIDIAKVTAAMVKNDGPVEKYLGIDLLEKDSLDIVAIPTTAGTGSEVTPIAILSDTKEKVKKGLVSNRIIPSLAILDPRLTVSLPQKVTAATGMDALVHAIEAFLSKNANQYSNHFALKAIEIITNNIKAAYDQGDDIQARENMLYGSLLAGIAFANAGVAAVHAFAYPLGGMFHIPHGVANSVMLTTVLQFNLPGCGQKTEQLAAVLLGEKDISSQKVVDYIEQLCKSLKIPMSLAELDIPKEAIPQMAESVMKITRLLSNNPREITIQNAMDIYSAAYEGKRL